MPRNPQHQSYRAQVDEARNRLTTAAIDFNATCAARPEDTEGAARVLLEHALVIRAQADAITSALLTRLQGRAAG